MVQVRQMTRQYPFAFTTAGPFAWRARDDEERR
jgi:hypothetical protein